MNFTYIVFAIVYPIRASQKVACERRCIFSVTGSAENKVIFGGTSDRENKSAFAGYSKANLPLLPGKREGKQNLVIKIYY